MATEENSTTAATAGTEPASGITTKARDRQKWLIRSALLGAALIPIPSLVAYGCDSPTQFDDLCGWTRDSENCYREFFVDVGARCGVAGQTRPGEFAGRDKLDSCFLVEGGIIEFEPPLSLLGPGQTTDEFTGVTEPQKMTFINSDQTECGFVEFRAKYDFTVSINGEALPDAGVDANDLPESFVVGGTFDIRGSRSDIGATAPSNSESYGVTCPSDVDPTAQTQGAPTFLFNRLQITNCRQFEPILPHAEIDFNPGGIGQTGVVRLNVFYPPELTFDEAGEIEGTPSPQAVNYFECFIPAAPPTCENGIKDGSETDQDCGGGFCSQRCGDGQLCINDADCISGTCAIDMGIKKCAGNL